MTAGSGYEHRMSGGKKRKILPALERRNHVRVRYLGQTVEEEIMPENIPNVPEVKQEANLDFDMPDIPMPDETKAEKVVVDKFESAVKYAFLGIGQGGSRLVEEFNRVGYTRVAVANTAKQDLDGIALPDEKKLWCGAGGTAKNRRVGAACLSQHSEELMDLMRRSFGTQFDRILICVTCGGGTGSGGFEVAVKVANELTEMLRIKKVGEPSRVGLMMVLPSNSERDRMVNTVEAMKAVEGLLKANLVSPVLLIDNEQIGRIYSSATVGNVWQKSNQSIVTLFHLFNKIAGVPSSYSVFDPEEYRSILSSGIVVYGATPIKDTSKDGMPQAFRDGIKKNVLCGGMDIGTAKSVACLIVGESTVVEAIPWDVVEHSYEMLGRVCGGATVHRGIYAAKRPLSAYTLGA
jgi:cell division GTPase FtsZ